MKRKSTLMICLILICFACYGKDLKNQSSEKQTVKTEQKKQIVEEEYQPEKSGQYNPKVLVFLDDTIITILYAWDYCHKLKKGKYTDSFTPKEAIDNWGEKGRYGAVIYKSFK